MTQLKLGLQLGYWGAGPPATGFVELAQEAERLGYDSVWTAEAWGSDAFTPLTWIAARTSRIRLGTRRRPDGSQDADRDRDARDDPGPPVRGPVHARPRPVRAAGRRGLVRQGPFPALPRSPPSPRVRRRSSARCSRREKPVALDGGVTTRSPTGAPDGTGLGRPLKPILHPLRADVPILLGAEGPRTWPGTRRTHRRRLAAALLLPRAR